MGCPCRQKGREIILPPERLLQRVWGPTEVCEVQEGLQQEGTLAKLVYHLLGQGCCCEWKESFQPFIL